MISQKWFREIGIVLSLGLVYFVAGKLGLTLAFVHPSSSAVWPPTGIALGAFLVLGYRVWPGVLLGAFFVNLTTAGTVLTSLGIAIGNTLEGLLGAWLVLRFAHGRRAFDTASDTFKFATLGGLIATMVAATAGVISLCLGGYASWAQFGSIWITWWLGDGIGAVLVGPVVILWAAGFGWHMGWKRSVELLVLIVSLVFVAAIVFCGLFVPTIKSYPLEYLCIPFLLWTALRFGQKEAGAIMLALAATAGWGTLHGFGPFVTGNKNESLLLLQAFMGVVAVMTMALAAMSAERNRIDQELARLAVTDPLTGIANYAKLIEVLDSEIRRSARTLRRFAILLIDLDGLKKINDCFGHLTGSRALCRLSEILRIYCRNIDTAARYGGDEFVLVMPETERKEAERVALRICSRIEDDVEQPPISASAGAAIYPDDGETIELLISAADRAMYKMKHHNLGENVDPSFNSKSR